VHPPDRPLAEEFQHAWSEAVRAAGSHFRQIPAAIGEQQLIDPASGVAQLGWPTDVESTEALRGFDLLLLTATEPTPTKSTDYPSAQEVADAWRADPNGHVSYFYNNRQNGITTFQDNEIQRILRGELPKVARKPVDGGHA